MRWSAEASAAARAAAPSTVTLADLLTGPSASCTASGTLMKYHGILQTAAAGAAEGGGGAAEAVAALSEGQLLALGLKPFHARRLRRWVALLEETAAEEAAPPQQHEQQLAGGDEVEELYDGGTIVAEGNFVLHTMDVYTKNDSFFKC